MHDAVAKRCAEPSGGHQKHRRQDAVVVSSGGSVEERLLGCLAIRQFRVGCQCARVSGGSAQARSSVDLCMWNEWHVVPSVGGRFWCRFIPTSCCPLRLPAPGATSAWSQSVSRASRYSQAVLQGRLDELGSMSKMEETGPSTGAETWCCSRELRPPA